MSASNTPRPSASMTGRQQRTSGTPEQAPAERSATAPADRPVRPSAVGGRPAGAAGASGPAKHAVPGSLSRAVTATPSASSKTTTSTTEARHAETPTQTRPQRPAETPTPTPAPTPTQAPADGSDGSDGSDGPAARGPAYDTVGPPAEATGGQQPRRRRTARLVLAKVDPWSVMKLSFLLSIALAVVVLVAVFMLWSVLSAMGVFESASRTIADVTQGEEGGAFDLMRYAGLSRVLGVTAMLACLNIALMTALSTLAAFLYNIATSLVGGLHITLTEES